MAQLELNLLGGLTLRQNGSPLTEVKSKKGKALLCYLAVRQRQETRTSLAALFWPDMPDSHALTNLRKVLQRMKPLTHYLVIDRQSLAFNQDAEYWLDVAEFEEETAANGDIRRVQRGLSLYQGDFLEGFLLPDAPLFEEWVLSQRARLRETALYRLQTLITTLSGKSDYATAIGHARQLLAIEPYHEETHRELMHLLALSGERSAALQQYETCRRILADEIGVEPALATSELYRQIQAEQVAPEPVRPVTLRPAAHPAHSLPSQVTPFVGRSLELAALEQYLADPDVRMITITGPGGVGKTRLALAAAANELRASRQPPSFPHGVYFVSLARLQSPDLLLPALAEGLGYDFNGSGDPKAQLLGFLRHKTMLLVLDNFEHLLAGAVLLDELVRLAPGVTLLVTSRTRLNRKAEHLFPIEGLTFPKSGAAEDENLLSDISSYSALELFRQGARRVRPDLALTRSNLPAVIDICRLVEGMPLGIVLATSWLDTLSPREIVREIQNDLDFLAADMEDAPRRQRSLRAAFNHSWRLLNNREQEIFQQLSVFRGGFTRPAASEVVDAQLRDLQSLVAKSLLTLTADSRYEIHELVRQFAAERVAGSPEKERAVRARHSSYYCALLHQHTERWHTARQLETLAEVTLEADNIQMAWEWAVRHREWRRLRKAMDSWGWYHQWRGRFKDGEAFCQNIIEGIEVAQVEDGPGSTESLRLWARALSWQGKFTMAGEVALCRLQHGLALLQRKELKDCDTRFERAFVHLAVGENYYSLDRQKARQHYDASLRLFGHLEADWGEAEALCALGHLDWATGDYASGVSRIRTALSRCEVRGDLRAQIWCKSSLAWVQQHLGELGQAEDLRREVVDLCRQLGERSSLTYALAYLSYTLFWQGKFEEGKQCAEESLALCLEDSRNDVEGFVRLAIGMALLLMGQYERAGRELRRALARVREANTRGEEASVHWALSCVALVESDYAGARAALDESFRLYSEVDDQYRGLAISGLGYVACLQNNLPQSRLQFGEALAYALRLRDYVFLIVTLPGVALYLARTGDAEQALAVWARAQREPFVANSQWFTDVVGQRMATVAETLPGAVVAAARAQGEARNLWETVEELIL
jgi:predicted ATPase/DNA-binding SARP family transcriptional activator/tetratricopeptide (TPR) repeat protein